MQGTPGKSSSWIVVAVIVVVVVCACLICAAVGGVGLYFILNQVNPGQGMPTFVEPGQPTATVQRPPAGPVNTDTEDTLRAVIVPDNDPYDLACRLQNDCGVANTIPAPASPYQVGDRRTFWIMNSDTTENFQVDTSLRYITPHSYFWLQDGIKADDKDISDLMTAFEDKIYPTDRQFFGSEWTPGVDNDPHIYVLYVRGVGASTGGYYSTPDEYNPKIRKYSNAAELFVFNADGESLTDEYTYGTLAHEFQHMIHWNLDRNESSWMNEGFSELAAFLNGYTVGGADFAYAQNPDIPLLDWTSLSDSPGVTGRHYGQSFLFLTYFLDRFGDKATRALVKDQENSLTSVDDVLKNLAITDPETGQPVTADDVVVDWMVTMFLGDGSVGDGRYVYHNYPDAPRASATERISTCPHTGANGTVSQYGPEYIEITCAGQHEITFTGSTVASLLPADPYSGKYAIWSNKGDESDMTLTREFDFTNTVGPIDFSYWTWYDIEEGYDYLYLEASTDGAHWDILKTPSCSDQDTSGNAFGCGYTAKSRGGDTAEWIQESVDLSAYAGHKVQLRFEYITDAALNGEGLLLDDLAIPAINYSTDFETDDGGWEPNGFARIENALPQTYRVELITQGNGATAVEPVSLSQDQTATIPVDLQSGESVIVVVTGTQRFTRLPAGFTLDVR
jgi:immune inhibitor A